MSTGTAVVRYVRPPLEQRRSIMERICERVANRELVEHAARAEGVTGTTVRNWVAEDPALLAIYMRAREASADSYAELALEVADGTDALGTTADELAMIEASSMTPLQSREFLAAFNAARINRDRLRIDTLKWTAAKRRPRVYGDKVDVTSGDQPLAAPQVIVIGGREIQF